MAAQYLLILTGICSSHGQVFLTLKEEVRLLHFERDANDYYIIKPKLEEIYGLKGTRKYLLDIKLCLIPEISTVTNFTTHTKIEWHRNHQGRFGGYIV